MKRAKTLSGVASIEKCNLLYETMKGFDRPWAIAGGWSTDLFLGKATREHDDIEIIVFRNDQIAVRQYLIGWTFTKVENGIVTPWGHGEFLLPPIHETYAERWNEKIEILLNETDGDNWIYRRDSRIHRKLQIAVLTTKNEIPILSPEITLLYKSKNPRPKDMMDFANIYKHLDLEQKQWLQESLKLIYIEHPWMALLN
jgi:hypothetical protein